jgi:GNAT superfamily N-acetyltransferase
VRLREASAEEAATRDALTFEAWGAPLTLEQWRSREATLRAHPWARAAMRTWLWEDGGQVLSSLETFEAPSRLKREGGPERGTSWLIASVYTEPGLRGRGHASALLAAVIEEAKRRALQSLLLFSDVGEAIYRRAGFEPLPRTDWVLPPVPGTPLESAEALLTSVSEAELSRALVGIEGPFAIRPTAEQLDWALERSRFYARALGQRLPAICGARAGTALAFWRIEPRKRLIEVLFLSAQTQSDADSVLRAACQLAHASALREVRLWGTGLPAGLSPPAGAVANEREGSWPMIRPLVTGLSPAQLTYVPRALWV